jgi:hypothetical protein
MSFLSAKGSTTVRQRSPWRMSATAGLVIFLLAAAAAFGWKYRQLPPPQPIAPPSATARVSIHHPTFAYQSAWQAIQAQSKSDIRDHLVIVADCSGGITVVSISLSDVSRETIVPMVNFVASAFAQNCRSQWQVDAEQAYTATQEKVREAQRAVQAADTRLELLRQRQRERTAAGGASGGPSSPAMVENPQWTEAARRLAELEKKRRELLSERTPMHPSVREIEMRIDDTRRDLSSIPAKIAQAPSGVPRPTLPPVAPGELSASEQAYTVARSQLQQAENAARAALVTRSGDLVIDVEPADVPPPVVVPQRLTATLLGAVLLAAATSLIGLGMISFGVSLEPAVSTIAELQSLVTAPILGVVPATHPSQPGRSTVRRQFVRCMTILSGSLLLVAVGWFLFRA